MNDRTCCLCGLEIPPWEEVIMYISSYDLDIGFDWDPLPAHKDCVEAIRAEEETRWWLEKCRGEGYAFGPEEDWIAPGLGFEHAARIRAKEETARQARDAKDAEYFRRWEEVEGGDGEFDWDSSEARQALTDVLRGGLARATQVVEEDEGLSSDELNDLVADALREEREEWAEYANADDLCNGHKCDECPDRDSCPLFFVPSNEEVNK